MTVDIMEEHSSWWREPCNTCLLLGNKELMFQNSRGLIDVEISDMEHNLAFLKRIRNNRYEKAWEYYDEITRKAIKRELQDKPRPVQKKPVLTIPEPMVSLDKLIRMVQSNLEIGVMSEEMKKVLLKQAVGTLNDIDTKMRAVDYTFDGMDYFEEYQKKAEELAGYVKALKKLAV